MRNRLLVLAALLAGCSSGSGGPGGSTGSAGTTSGSSGTGGSTGSGASCQTLGVECGKLYGYTTSGDLDCGLCRYRREETNVPADELAIAKGPSGVWIAAAAVGSGFTLLHEEDGGLVQRAQGGPTSIERTAAHFLAVRSDGTPVVTWSDLGNIYLGTPVEDGGLLAQPVVSGEYPSIAIGPDGVVHLAYIERSSATRNNAVHTQETQGAWSHDLIETFAANTPTNPAVGVAPDNSVHVLYGLDEFVSTALRHGYRAPGASGFVVDVIDGGASGPSAALAFDAQSTLHAVWPGEDGIEYGRFAGGSWAVSGVNGLGAYAASVSVDQGGKPHLVSGAVYGALAGGQFALQALGTCEHGQSDLVIDDSDTPAVALDCEGVALLRPVGRQPDSFAANCQHIAQVACSAACDCYPDGGAAIDCCVSGGFGSSCSHPFACPANIAAHLCGDPTTDPALVQTCNDALGAFTCTNVNGDLGVELPAACQPLSD